MSDWRTLIDAQTLAAALQRDDVAVLDCRFDLADPAAGERAFRDAHIPGARYAHLDHDLSDHDKRGQGRHPLPDAARFAATLGRWGITPRHRVAVYDADAGSFAARAWWMLRAIGHAQAAVLDGGFAAWRAAGLPVASGDEEPATAATYPSVDGYAGTVDVDALRAGLADGTLTLVDARAAPRFRGDVEPLDAVAGHVPGAVNRPFADNLGDDGRFKPASMLAGEFRALLRDASPREVAVMCGSGVTACHHLLAMAHAGLDGARLYAPSWSGWIADPARPVARGG